LEAGGKEGTREGGRERGREGMHSPDVLGYPQQSIAVRDTSFPEGRKEGVPVRLQAAKGGVEREAEGRGGREAGREGGNIFGGLNEAGG